MAADPLEQFEITPIIPIQIGGLDISFTNSALWMTITVVLSTGFLTWAMRRRALVPNGWQLVAEVLYQTVANMIRDNVACKTPIVFAGDVCSSVLGSLTLYSDESRLLKDEDTIRTLFRKAMEDRAFNDVHPRIVRVTYVDLQDDDVQADPVATTRGDLDADEGLSAVGIGMIAFAGAVALVLCAGIVYCRSRRNTEDDETATGIGGSQPQTEPLVVSRKSLEVS